MPEAGTYPISFRYANGGRNGDGNTPLQLSVNGEVIASAYPFIYTDSWSFYKYSDMIDATLNAGSNMIRIEITEDHFGPNIDHLRVGKPPAVVMKVSALRVRLSLLVGRAHFFQLLVIRQMVGLALCSGMECRCSTVGRWSGMRLLRCRLEIIQNRPREIYGCLVPTMVT